MPVQNTVSEMLKMRSFLYSAFWLAGQEGKSVALPPFPPSYATAYDENENRKNFNFRQY